MNCTVLKKMSLLVMMILSLSFTIATPGSSESQEQEVIIAPSRLERCKLAFKNNRFYLKQVFGVTAAAVAIASYVNLHLENKRLNGELRGARNIIWCAQEMFDRVVLALATQLNERGVSEEVILDIAHSLTRPLYAKYGLDPKVGLDTRPSDVKL